MALALQAGLLGFRGGLGFDLDALCFGALAGGFLLTLGGVNGVHRVLDLRARVNRGDQGLDDGEAETAHFRADGLLHVGGDIVLAGERVIKGERRNCGTQRVLHVAAQLAGRILQLIVCRGDGFRSHAELRGGDHGDEHVVQGLGLQLHIQLADPHIRFHGDAVDERDFHTQARILNFMELAEPFNDVSLLLRDHVQCGAQQKHHDDNQGDNKRHVGFLSSESARSLREQPASSYQKLGRILGFRHFQDTLPKS